MDNRAVTQNDFTQEIRHDDQGQECRVVQFLQSLDKKRPRLCRKGPGCKVLPVDRKSLPTLHARGTSPGVYYWVLQSPSLL